MIRNKKSKSWGGITMNFLKKLISFNFFKKSESKIDLKNLPAHIAIVLDGNGRWAKKKGIPRAVGHREGAQVLKRIVFYCEKIGIKFLTVYAFSTENWKRPKEEVEALMKLLKEFLSNADKELGKKNIKIKILGDISALPTQIQDEIIRVEKSTERNSGLVFNVALNYGSRVEIINAVKKLSTEVANGRIKVNDITEELFANYLYTKTIPNPDLLIRTSGEYRLSNFLLWQMAYTELWFDDVLWPDFREEHLLKAIQDFQNRERRFGGI